MPDSLLFSMPELLLDGLRVRHRADRDAVHDRVPVRCRTAWWLLAQPVEITMRALIWL